MLLGEFSGSEFGNPTSAGLWSVVDPAKEWLLSAKTPRLLDSEGPRMP